MHEDLATDFTVVHKSRYCLAGNLPVEQSSGLYRATQVHRREGWGPEHLSLSVLPLAP